MKFPNRQTLAAAACLLVPAAVCLWLYQDGLWIWFQQDDFAWLSLRRDIHSAGDFWRLLFIPKAQGTIRPLSERLYFIVLSSLFGMDSLPFRIVAFLTQIANLILIGRITLRLTGSRWASLWAPLLWAVNSTLLTVMTWSSVYNQALCAFFLLSAFLCFVKLAETGLRRYEIWQWVFFVLGFGALEINVVYPAIAAAYALLRDRRLLLRTIPLFAVSLLFAIVHRSVAPKEPAPLYRMYFDASLFRSFWKYWLQVLGPTRMQELSYWTDGRLVIAAVSVLTIGLLAFAAWRWRQGQPIGLWFLAWYVITLSPVLPLRDHVSDYYLTIPSIGLAMLGGWALASAWATWSGRVLGTALAAIYVAANLPVIEWGMDWNFERAERVQTLVEGVGRAKELYPNRTILLTDIPDDLFWTAIIDNPFRLVGAMNVYLAPEAAARISRHPELGSVEEFTLPQAPVLEGIRKGKLAVYAFAGDRLKNVTRVYESIALLRLKDEVPRRINVGNDLFDTWVGTGWNPVEQGYRWMTRRGTVRLGGPRNASEALYLTVYVSDVVMNGQPLIVRVSVDGKPLEPASITNTGRVDLRFAFPPEAVGRTSVEVAVEVNRWADREKYVKEMGLAFGVFEVR